eukprot:UN4194
MRPMWPRARICGLGHHVQVVGCEQRQFARAPARESDADEVGDVGHSVQSKACTSNSPGSDWHPDGLIPIFAIPEVVPELCKAVSNAWLRLGAQVLLGHGLLSDSQGPELHGEVRGEHVVAVDPGYPAAELLVAVEGLVEGGVPHRGVRHIASRPISAIKIV